MPEPPYTYIRSRLQKGKVMFQFLVTESGAKVAHTAPDLASYAKVPVERLQPLLEQLAGKVRILAPVAPPSDRPDLLRYEIYHDSLGRAVLDWRRRYVGAQEGRNGVPVCGGSALILKFLSLKINYGGLDKEKDGYRGGAPAENFLNATWVHKTRAGRSRSEGLRLRAVAAAQGGTVSPLVPV